MRSSSAISQKLLVTSIVIPVFSIYLLTIGCAVDDFVIRCCQTPTSSQIAHHKSQHDHDDAHAHSHHRNNNKHSHDHSTNHNHQHRQEQKNDDCCSDITTSFFNIFQGQPKEVLLEGPLKVDIKPFVSVLNDVDQWILASQPHIFTWQMPPPGQIPTGPLMRIFLQSFLN